MFIAVTQGHVRPGLNLGIGEGFGKIVAAPLGADFSNLPNEEAAKLGIPGGVIVTRIYAGGALSNQTKMREGFIITRIGNSSVTSIAQMNEALRRQQGICRMRGIYPGNKQLFYYVVRDF